MELFPAIDLQNGQCVRLVKGDFATATIYEKDPILQAKRFAEAGATWIHVIDLDGARDGASRQTEIVKRIAQETGLRVETGGGIRDERTIEELLDAGVSRVIVGSLAVKNPELVKGWIRQFGADRIVLALDVRINEAGEAEILVDGWQKGGGVSLEAGLAMFVEAGAKTVLCTDVGRDGLLTGTNVELYRDLVAAWPGIEILASGGVSGLADLEAAAKAGCAGAVIGKAIYEGKIDLKEAFEKQKSALIFPLGGSFVRNDEESSQSRSPIPAPRSPSFLAKRIIPCLDVKNGRVVKGVRFRDHEDMGDILELAERYRNEGADELVFYDISASPEDRRVSRAWVSSVAEKLDIPFCVAGGIRTCEDARQILANGADKISINSPALENPTLIDDMARAFGNQCVVIGIDSREEDGDYWVYQYTGDEKRTVASKRRMLDWAREVVARGAGEIVLNCMNNDGVREGYDLKQLAALRAVVSVPVIASGGAGTVQHFIDVFREAKVDGALAASVFHKKLIAIPDLKRDLQKAGIVVRI